MVAFNKKLMERIYIHENRSKGEVGPQFVRLEKLMIRLTEREGLGGFRKLIMRVSYCMFSICDPRRGPKDRRNQ